MTEREQRGNVRRVPVAHEQAFAIFDLMWLPGEPRVRGHVSLRGRECLGQSATRVDIAVQDVDQRGSRRLAAEVALQHGGGARQPRHHDGATVGQRHHGVWVGLCHRVDQTFLLGGKVQVGSIEPLALVDPRQPGQDHHHVCLCRGCHGLVDQALVHAGQHRVVPGGVGDREATFGERLPRSCDPDRIDQGTA